MKKNLNSGNYKRVKLKKNYDLDGYNYLRANILKEHEGEKIYITLLEYSKQVIENCLQSLEQASSKSSVSDNKTK